MTRPRMTTYPSPPGFGIFPMRENDRMPGMIRAESTDAKADRLSQLLTYSSGSSPGSDSEPTAMEADDECSSSG